MNKKTITALLELIAKEETKEKKVREWLSGIIEWNGFVDITSGMCKALELILPADIYDWLSYYLWESNRKGNVTTASGKTYIFETDTDFITYLEAEGYLTE